MKKDSKNSDDDFEHACDVLEREDYKTAYKLILPLAEQGNAYAQCTLGWHYEKGLGVTQDYTEAVKWHRLAAEQGFADGQCGLGELYYGGEGVPHDYAEAIKWWKLAAEQGHEEAQYNLANNA